MSGEAQAEHSTQLSSHPRYYHCCVPIGGLEGTAACTGTYIVGGDRWSVPANRYHRLLLPVARTLIRSLVCPLNHCPAHSFAGFRCWALSLLPSPSLSPLTPTLNQFHQYPVTNNLIAIVFTAFILWLARLWVYTLQMTMYTFLNLAATSTADDTVTVVGTISYRYSILLRPPLFRLHLLIWSCSKNTVTAADNNEARRANYIYKCKKIYI